MKFLLLILLVSCATTKKSKEISPSEISNADFKKPKIEKYNSNDDFFKKVDNKDTVLLNDESVARLDDFSDIADEDIFTSIAKFCYQKKFDQAWSLIREGYDKFHKNPVFWNQVGNCYLRNQKYRKALLYYNKSLEFKTNYVPALNNIGVMYWNQGEHQKAAVAFKKATTSGDFAKTPRFNLALLYLEYGLSEKAITNLEKLILLGKSDLDVKSALVTANLMNKNYSKAASYCSDLDDNFNKVNIGLNCSLAYLEMNKKDKAKSVFKEIEADNLGPWKNYYQDIKRRVE